MHKDKIFFVKYDYDPLQLVSVKTRKRIARRIHLSDNFQQLSRKLKLSYYDAESRKATGLCIHLIN